MLFLGIDGGGTKTKVMVLDGQRNILFEGISGPSSLDTVDEKTTVDHINQALSNFIEENGDTVFTAVFAGLGGIASDKEKKRLFELLLQVKGVDHTTKRFAGSDMENALASGLYFEEGMTLIAGTGMVAYGRNKSGVTHKAGGLGFKEGDLGSSYDLGINAIRAAARTLDNRYISTPFTDEVIRHINVTTANDIVHLMDAWHTERTTIASLAPIVTKHANLENQYAMKICDSSCHELALSINAVQSIIKLPNPQLVIVGSLGNADGYFKKQLHMHLKSYIPNITITSPKVDPAFAAALLAMYNFNPVDFDY